MPHQASGYRHAGRPSHVRLDMPCCIVLIPCDIESAWALPVIASSCPSLEEGYRRRVAGSLLVAAADVGTQGLVVALLMFGVQGGIGVIRVAVRVFGPQLACQLRHLRPNPHRTRDGAPVEAKAARIGLAAKELEERRRRDREVDAAAKLTLTRCQPVVERNGTALR
jgi:hypothetical protein